jgi:protein-disulfide isomerase
MRQRLFLALALGGLAACRGAGGEAGGDAGKLLPSTSASAPADGPPAADPRVRRADLSRIMGDSAATVWMVIASDFQCPYCKMWHATAQPEIVRDYVNTGKIRVAYVNFPLNSHQNSVPAAEAAMCAGSQDRFWDYGARLFDTQPEWGTLPDAQPVFLRLAAAAGLDTAAFGQCLREHVMLAMVQADRRRGDEAGVAGTPSFFIGKRVIDRAMPASYFRPILDSAVAETARQEGRVR